MVHRSHRRLARAPRCAVISALLCLALTAPAIAETRHTRIDARTAGVLEFIGALEAPGGYDVYSHYAAEAPPKPLTRMTVNEVLAWQEHIDARSKSEAAGRYQIIEDTLRDYVVPTMGLTGREVFSPGMQDAMAVVLMRRRGWDPASTDHVRMGNALAREWAALPQLSGEQAGRSVYHDTKGARNRALTTPAIFLSVLENPASHPHAVKQSRQRRSGHNAGSGAAHIRIVSRSERAIQRPASPKTLTGGGLSPSRVIVFRSDPYRLE